MTLSSSPIKYDLFMESEFLLHVLKKMFINAKFLLNQSTKATNIFSSCSFSSIGLNWPGYLQGLEREVNKGVMDTEISWAGVTDGSFEILRNCATQPLNKFCTRNFKVIFMNFSTKGQYLRKLCITLARIMINFEHRLWDSSHALHSKSLLSCVNFSQSDLSRKAFTLL